MENSQMSEVSSAKTLQDVSDVFLRKISTLQMSANIYSGMGADVIKENVPLVDELRAVGASVAEFRQVIAEAKVDLDDSKRLLQSMQQMQQQMEHMITHFPVQALKPKLVAVSNVACKTSGGTERSNGVLSDGENLFSDKTSAKALPESGIKTIQDVKKTKEILLFRYVTMEEFESIPKYIRGRLSYSQVNNAVEDLNKAMTNKFILLSRPRQKLSSSDMKIVREFRCQNIADLKDQFIIDEDIKRWCKLKLDNSGRAILILLRTLKRFREVRGPGNLLRYAVLSG